MSSRQSSSDSDPPSPPADDAAPQQARGAAAADDPAGQPADVPSRWYRWLLVTFAAAMTVQWLRLTSDRPAAPPVQRGEVFTQTFRVNVNTATWVEWMQLEGIGQSLAHRIVADRELNGPFRSIDDLTRVSGIGPKTLDRIRPWLTILHADDTARTDDALELLHNPAVSGR